MIAPAWAQPAAPGSARAIIGAARAIPFVERVQLVEVPRVALLVHVNRWCWFACGLLHWWTLRKVRAAVENERAAGIPIDVRCW